MRPSIIVLLASALIVVGVILACGVLFRLSQEFQWIGKTDPPVLLVVVVGSMRVATPTSDQPKGDQPLVPLDPCPPTLADGLPVGTEVQAIGIVRIYPEPDTLAKALAEQKAGDQVVVVLDASGATAIKRCAVVWVRVRTAAAVEGWVLDVAIERVPPPAPISPCPSPGCVSCGCGQQQSGCGQPCGCTQPCNDGQPCYPSCGNPCDSQPAYPCYNPCQLPCGYQGYDPGYPSDPYPNCDDGICQWTPQ